MGTESNKRNARQRTLNIPPPYKRRSIESEIEQAGELIEEYLEQPSQELAEHIYRLEIEKHPYVKNLRLRKMKKLEEEIEEESAIEKFKSFLKAR